MDTPLIHVVDDDESLRSALLRLLELAGYEVRGYGSAGEFLLSPPPERPGCLLLDLRMPGPSGLDLQEAMLRRQVRLPVIFMSAHADVASSVKALRAGAVDFLTKPFDRQQLLDALGRALARDAAARAAHAELRDVRARLASLTAREREVFDQVTAGLLNKQVAGAMEIAERTVKHHRARLMEKLGVGSAAELGRLAERLRLLSEREAAGADSPAPPGD